MGEGLEIRLTLKGSKSSVEKKTKKIHSFFKYFRRSQAITENSAVHLGSLGV